MRRLIKLSINASVVVLIFVALLVSFLRLLLPHLNDHRQFLLESIQTLSGLPIEVRSIEGEWLLLGPKLKLQGLSLHDKSADINISEINVELNIWRSVLSSHLYFQALTTKQVNVNIKTDIFGHTTQIENKQQSTIVANIVNALLKQINYLSIKESQIKFLSPTSEKLVLKTTKFSWINDGYHHKANSIATLVSSQGNVGQLHAIFDFKSNTKFNFHDGVIYFETDNIDMQPWLTNWLRTNTGLSHINVNLATWLVIKNGQLDNGTFLLKQSNINWRNEDRLNKLEIDQQQVNFKRHQKGWLIDLPVLNMATNNIAWPKGQLKAFWLPEDKIQTGKMTPQLRIRAENLQIERITPLLSLYSFANQAGVNALFGLNPHGRLTHLGLDIPFANINNTQFSISWQDISWNAWHTFPRINRFTGAINGDLSSGKLYVGLKNSQMTFPTMFRAPLLIKRASGELYWINNKQDLKLWSKGLDIQAKSLWINGDFSYVKPIQGKALLQILSGIHLYDVKDAWRYYPEPLMGKSLVNYLTSALINGQANNATLLYFGDPQDFPYYDHSGIFQVWVPLRDATFKFQPEWLPFTHLGIDLNFINDSLWMTAKHGMLGRATASNITANIPAYHAEKLFVNAHINGQGNDITDYLEKSPLKNSVASTLQSIQVRGEVNGDLNLFIPITNDQSAMAKGKIYLKNNDIHLSMLNSTLSKVTGEFNFDNNILTSQVLSANWLAQPISLRFSTDQSASDYHVNINLGGKWYFEKLPQFPAKLTKDFSALMDWNSTVSVTLPTQAEAHYKVKLQGKLVNISKRLQTLLHLTNNILSAKFNVIGTENNLTVAGNLNNNTGINTLWHMKSGYLQLKKGIWQTNTTVIPKLPKQDSLKLALPELDGTFLMGVLNESGIMKKENQPTQLNRTILLPETIEIMTPTIALFGQYWRNAIVTYRHSGQNQQIIVDGNEFKGQLWASSPDQWHATIDYIYYNPYTYFIRQKNNSDIINTFNIDFRHWPKLDLLCKQCWLMGQNYNHISGHLFPDGNTLLLKDGQIKMEDTLFSVDGKWHKTSHTNSTSFLGKVQSTRLDRTMRHFGVITPIISNAPANVGFQLQWQGYPWQPEIATLSGTVDAELGKGMITSIDVGRTGQLLRMVSISSLLKKLQLDFSDSFTKGFDFNSIQMHGTFKKGIFYTNNTLIDGSIADIALRGNVDLTKNTLSLKAMIAPEISTTIGVATAVTINPIVGAAIFAATKALIPLWSKISFIHYSITGTFDNPSVNETFRQDQHKMLSE